VWYLASNEAGTDKVMVQNGDLTYTLPDDSQGKWVSVVETARNQAGSMQSGTGPDQIAGPLPVWTRLPVITGNNLLTPTQGSTLSAITPLARDPITGGDATVSWDWYVQYPGQAAQPLSHPFTTYNFANDNGRWTGAAIFIRATATNAIGTITTESNKITLQGTPRILSQGNLYSTGFGAAFRFGVRLCTFDGGSQTATSTWSVGAYSGAALATGFNNPTLSIGGGSFPAQGDYIGKGQQSMTNDQGATTYTFPDQPFTYA
jgi:hypothetical protein